MLDKGVVAVKADKAKTLDMINKEEGGFLDRDLYVFCFNLSDGKQVAAGSNNSRKYARTSGPLKTQLAKRTAPTSTLPRRKVKSLRSATCFQSRAPTRHRLQR
jgi:hypothetical protein